MYPSIQPHGTDVLPPQRPKHPDEGPSVIRLWSPSMEGRTSLCSSGRRTSNPHAYHSDDPGSHGRSPSKPCTKSNAETIFTYGAKPRCTVLKCPVCPIMSTSAGALHLLHSSLHRLEHSLRPPSAQGCDIRRRNVTQPPRWRSGQVIDQHIMKPLGTDLKSPAASVGAHMD